MNYNKQIFEYHQEEEKVGGGGVPLEEEVANEEFTAQEDSTAYQAKQQINESGNMNRNYPDDDGGNFGVIWGGTLKLDDDDQSDEDKKKRTMEARRNVVRRCKRFASAVNLKLKQNRRFLFKKIYDDTIPVINVETYLEAAFEISVYDAWATINQIKYKYRLNGGPLTISAMIENEKTMILFAELVANEYNRAKADNLTQTQRTALSIAELQTTKKIYTLYKSSSIF